jgi:poly-gamma-glutamate capsule biosynthesis protein CapA/YwtB (metallophosphatase superfamily)
LLTALPCAADVSITGRVLSESGEGLAGASIRLDGQSAISDETGRFTLNTEPAGIYRLDYSANKHFPIIHSYSALEFSTQQASLPTAAITVPEVTLVERIDGRIMLAIGGDTMMGRRYSEPSDNEPALIREGFRTTDTVGLLRYIRPYLEQADFTTVNLETQVIDGIPTKNAPKSFVFYTPPEALLALKESGVDYVALANNHTYDYLSYGLESTIDALEASGLAWSGAGLTEAQALAPYRTRVGGNPLSFLSYLGWAGNFTPNQVAMGTEKGGAAFGTTANINRTVSAEVDQGFLPIVQYHGSREYTDEPTLVTETRLKQAVDDGAVLAIGHHPHVTQGFELYKGKLIAWSMGNFMFDQFHYATKRSYLLYVWMDGGRLHRAEVMPLRIKGYVPVPATDTFRQSVLKRVKELSGRRGIALQASGGNAVINPHVQGGEPDTASEFIAPVSSKAPELTIWPLHGRTWNSAVDSIAPLSQGGGQVFLGQNLLPMGHLEAHYLFAAPDRSWIADGSQTIVARDDAPSGENVMQLVVPAGQAKGILGMRTFEYTFEPGTPTSFVVKARSDATATVTAYEQWRKQGENRTDALETAKLRLIGEQELSAGGWQELRFDFDSPRVTAISYRIVLKVTPADDASDHLSWFDDIALIEWLSPPLNPGTVPAHVHSALASHVGRVIE